MNLRVTTQPAHRCVVFTSNTALVLSNPGNLDDLAKYPNVVIDPDLSKVLGIPNTFWKLDNGKIVPMNEEEQQRRLEHIERVGVDTVVRPRRDFNVVVEKEKPQVVTERFVMEREVFPKDILKKFYFAQMGFCVFQLLYLWMLKH